MKTAWKNGALVLLLTFAVGFKTDDVIELKQYLNGRGSPNFLSSTNNVQFVVPKGTKAKITSTKNFSSGNAGLYVEILDGPKKGEKVWIYHNKKNPGMKLYASEDANPQSQKARDVASAKSAELTRDHQGIRAGGAEGDKEISKAAFDALDKKMDKGAKALKKLDKCNENCEIAGATYSASDVSTMDAPFIVKPVNEANPYGLRDLVGTDPRCGVKAKIDENECKRLRETHPPLNYFQSTYVGDPEVGVYAISERKYDKATGQIEAVGRDWQFSFENQATQDIYFSVSDLTGIEKGRVMGTDSHYYLFPRESLPTIREADGKIIVTLPTGETASYDALTKKLVNGVLKETTAKGTSNISYTGKGLLMRIDGQGDNPRLSSTASVIKNGKVCKVPAAEFWPDRKEALHFKFKKDSTLKAFILKTCGKDFNF